MTDGYTGYQHLLSRLAGIQQCCQYVIRRCRTVIKLGPGGLQSWAGDIIAILREAHQAALGCWLREYKEQVFLFTREFTVDWTNNVSERGAKAAKRHQAVSGYWHSLATLARWCRIRSYLDSAAAHGITALDAIRTAIEGKLWLPPLRPAAQPRHSGDHELLNGVTEPCRK